MNLNFLAGRKEITTFVSIFRETYEHDCYRSLYVYTKFESIREYRKWLRDTLFVKILVQLVKRPTIADENNTWSDLIYRIRSWRKFKWWKKEIGTIVKMERKVVWQKEKWWSMHTFILMCGIYIDRRTELLLSYERKMRNSYEAFQASNSKDLAISISLQLWKEIKNYNIMLSRE